MGALAAKEALIPTTARFDVMHANQRLWTHSSSWCLRRSSYPSCSSWIFVLNRMRPYDCIVQLDAESRPGRDLNRPPLEDLLRLEYVASPVDLAPLELEQPEVVEHGAHLNARGRGNGAARIVGRDGDAV